MPAVDFDLNPGDYGVFLDSFLTDEQELDRIERVFRQVLGEGSLKLYGPVGVYLWKNKTPEIFLSVFGLELEVDGGYGDQPSRCWRLALEVRPGAESLFKSLLAELSSEFHAVVKVDSVDVVAANEYVGGALVPVGE
jgi:hypothetical protein